MAPSGGETALDQSESAPKSAHLSDNTGFHVAPLAAINARPIRTLHFKFQPIRMSSKMCTFLSLQKHLHTTYIDGGPGSAEAT